MPVVQKNPGRRVATDALPDVRRTAAETNLSLGVGVEQAKIGKANAIGQLGDVALGAGRQFAQIAIEERQKAIVADTLANDNKLARWTNQALYDPEAGALQVKGQLAMPLPEQVGKAYEKYADGIAAGIKTKEGREAFAKQRANRGTDLDLQLRRHVDQQMQQFYAGELKATVENGTNEAIALANSPDLVDKKIIEVTAALKAGGPKLLGMGPKELAATIGEFTTATHVGVINRLLADGQDRNASAYFQHNKDAITNGDARAQIETKLEVASNQTLGLETSDALWRQFGPKDGPAGDDTPIALDQMETAAREKFKDDPKALRATLEFLRERKAGVDASRADRKEATAGDLWGMVAKGATLKEITRSPAYLNAPGALQTQVKEHVVQEAQQAADRSYMLGQRGTAEAARQENEKERAGWSMLWHYDDPKILGQMSDNQVLALTPTIGIDHVNRLMTKKRLLTTTEAAVRVATIDDEDFKATAFQAGLPAYLTGADITDDQKAGLGKLRSTVETLIDREQQGTGKTLPRARRLEIMQQEVDKKVLVDYWTGDASVPAATVVNAKDRARAYVPLADVQKKAPAFLKAALNFILSSKGSSALLSLPQQEQIIRLGPQIQHAYALQLMGATDTAIDRALLGDPDPED